MGLGNRAPYGSTPKFGLVTSKRYGYEGLTTGEIGAIGTTEALDATGTTEAAGTW